MKRQKQCMKRILAKTLQDDVKDIGRLGPEGKVEISRDW